MLTSIFVISLLFTFTAKLKSFLDIEFQKPRLLSDFGIQCHFDFGRTKPGLMSISVIGLPFTFVVR